MDRNCIASQESMHIVNQLSVNACIVL